MKLKRTAARARNGIVSSTKLDSPSFDICKEDCAYSFVISSTDVPEFGNPKTHYDYQVLVSPWDLIKLIETAANSEGEAKEHIKSELAGHLGKLIKLLNLCAE